MDLHRADFIFIFFYFRAGGRVDIAGVQSTQRQNIRVPVFAELHWCRPEYTRLSQVADTSTSAVAGIPSAHIGDDDQTKGYSRRGSECYK